MKIVKVIKRNISFDDLIDDVEKCLEEHTTKFDQSLIESTSYEYYVGYYLSVIVKKLDLSFESESEENMFYANFPKYYTLYKKVRRQN